MTHDEHLAGLDLTMLDIEHITAAAFETLLRRTNAGEAPQDVLRDIEATWPGEYLQVLSSRMSERMAMSIGAVEMKDWPIGEVTLSDRLRENARDVSAVTLRIITQHTQGWHDASTLAADLYEGYRFRPEEPLSVSSRKAIPKYLRAAFGDDSALADLLKNSHTGKSLRILLDDPQTGVPLAQQYARIKAINIKTPALKAAYLQAIDAIKAGQGADRLKKQLKVAYYEKNRYFANRIAQTELHRAYTDRQSEDLMQQDRIDFVQIRLSGTHPRIDICDYHARVDHFGLGPGVYPKSKAPKPPFHPFCRCMVSPRIDIAPGTKYRERDGAGRAWLREQGISEGAKVLGSRDKLQAVLKGADVNAVVSAGVPGAYRVRLIGDSMDNPQMSYSEHGQRIISGLIDTASAHQNVEVGTGLQAMWENPSKFDGHVAKRIKNGDVIDADDYALKTFGVLGAARRIVVVEPSDLSMKMTGKVQVSANGWVVLLSERGRIVTSYPFDPVKPQFEQRHIDMGDTLHEHDIKQPDREILARLFGIR